MGQFIQIFLFVIIGILLLWLGYTLFFGMGSLSATYGYNSHKRRNLRPRGISYPGASHTCPVCSSKLGDGEMVKTLAFPSLNGGADRFMHIKGCLYCLYGDMDRVCPVCGHILQGDEVLICRLFDRDQMITKRSHVHVLGCSKCRGK